MQQTLHIRERASLKWVARDGKTPGWDIEYTDAQGQLISIEVKGTKGPAFPIIEITTNEWAAAHRLRDRYWLYLVAKCMDVRPDIQPIQDPAGLEHKQLLSATPLLWRLQLL